MHLTAPSHWSRSIGTGGRDQSESVVAIVGMRSLTVAGKRIDETIAVEMLHAVTPMAIEADVRACRHRLEGARGLDREHGANSALTYHRQQFFEPSPRDPERPRSSSIT
jgi:hypothetical protein